MLEDRTAQSVSSFQEPRHQISKSRREMNQELPTLLELLENQLKYASPKDRTVNIKISINTARMIAEAERVKGDLK